MTSGTYINKPTATDIGTSVGRLVSFRYVQQIVVNTVRFYSKGAIGAGTFAVAIYNGSTGSRLWMNNNFATVAGGWNALTNNMPFTVPADTLMWFGISALQTGATAVFMSLDLITDYKALGLATMPGSYQNYGIRLTQVALTAGAWPATLPTLADAAFLNTGKGSVPFFYLDYV